MSRTILLIRYTEENSSQTLSIDDEDELISILKNLVKGINLPESSVGDYNCKTKEEFLVIESMAQKVGLLPAMSNDYCIN